MKKSIAILSVVLLMVLPNQKENERPIQKGEITAGVAKVLLDQHPVACFSRKMSEGENPPWKDPWQWRGLFRSVWKFFK